MTPAQRLRKRARAEVLLRQAAALLAEVADDYAASAPLTDAERSEWRSTLDTLRPITEHAPERTTR